ncbi:hypothetical protein IW147_003078 [Coemansia sp. RSA 720]|nr:hypothetical protein IW147_003078 [Coemansia sp. RSA 720]
MHFAGFLVSVFAFALAAFASSVSSPENAQEYLLELVNRMAKYVAAQSRAGNQVSDIRDISLTDLGLASTETTTHVRDVLDTSAPHAKSSITNIPFNDVFAMQPSRVRYIASVFNVLSRVGPQFANQFARMLGVDETALGSSENMDAVARLALAISGMNTDSLAVVSRATRADETSDPLIKSGSLFALSNILAMQNTRVEHVARLFDSLSQLSVPQLQAYLHDIGWESTDTQKSEDGETDSIPNLSYMFPINDSLLDDMAEAAVDYSKGNTEPAAMIRSQVEEYLREARDFWDFIPGYSVISSAINISNSPLVGTLTDIITLLYKYPNASYWELALQYYKDMGMPGLSAVSAYPSQFVGSLASQFVGGYVSNAISGVVANILGPGIASVSTTSSHRLSSSKPSPSPTPPIPAPTPIPTPASAISVTSTHSSSLPKPTMTLTTTPPRPTMSLTTTSPKPTVYPTTTSPKPIMSPTTTSPSLSSSSNIGSTTSISGFWSGIFTIFTTTRAVAPAAPNPRTSSTAIKGTVAISPRPTPTYSKPTPAHSNALQATLDLNSNMSTRVTYTLVQQPEMLILTIIPRTH